MSNILSPKIRLSGIIEESIVDGPGIRFVVFTQGCLKRCVMCHNEETQALDQGYLKEADEIVKKWRKNPLLTGITLSGGEPFLQAKACLYLAKKALEDGLNVFVYSGYYYEELRTFNNPYVQELLDISTYLVDGPFEHTLKNLNLLFRGSSNQRIIDLQETKKAGTLILDKALQL